MEAQRVRPAAISPRIVTAVVGAMTTAALLLASLLWNMRQVKDLDPLMPPQGSILAEQVHAAARRAIDTGQTMLLLGSAAVAALTFVLTFRSSRWGPVWVALCGIASYVLAWAVTLDDVQFVHTHRY